MHETRKNEMSVLKEVPFERYYGGVDTTPLFVQLAGAYAARTQDLEFVDTLWDPLTAAMQWIESAMAASPGGFLTYERGEETGLVNQGWKDSFDSVFHDDGEYARGAIAMVEVQGYVHAALLAMSTLARRRNEQSAAEHWRERARALRRAIEDSFWMPDQGFYGIAIDGDSRLCRVRASNTGHLLYTGLPRASRARPVIAELLSPRFNSGWGIRTIAKGEARYNPMSYHNGTVWPHDTALAAAGMARYGERAGVVRLLSNLFEAADQFGMRLPELFCGFDRTPGEPPTAYPVACLPQAWAAGSAFMMIQACLGISIDGRRARVHVDRPRLPIGIDTMTIHDLAVGSHRIDLCFQSVGRRVAVYADGPEADVVPILVRA
jgi:glycogen debranching enzyme